LLIKRNSHFVGNGTDTTGFIWNVVLRQEDCWSKSQSDRIGSVVVVDNTHEDVIFISIEVDAGKDADAMNIQFNVVVTAWILLWNLWRWRWIGSNGQMRRRLLIRQMLHLLKVKAFLPI
jgi:hypothetical protein